MPKRIKKETTLADLSKKIDALAALPVQVQTLSGQVEALAALPVQVQTLSGQVEALAKFINGFSNRVDAKFEQVDARFEQVDARFEKIEKRLDHMVTKDHLILQLGDVKDEQTLGRAKQERRFDKLVKMLHSKKVVTKEERNALLEKSMV